MSKKIVAIGGGAISEAVLPALRNLKCDITTITSMTDSGGSGGAIRKEFDVHPVGDIRRHMLALSETEDWKKDLWGFRFANDIVFKGGHRGHNFANVFMAALEKNTKDFEKALKIAHKFLEVKGNCLPATMQKVNLFAKLENGKILKSEEEIDVPVDRNAKLKIVDLWLETEAKAGARAYPKAITAIKKANYIIIGPGDLYSSVLACFLAKGIKEAIKKTKAEIIYICNIPNKPGETLGMAASDYLSEVLKYTGLKKVDYVLANNSLRMKEEPVRPDRENLVRLAHKVIITDLASRESPSHHDYKKVGRALVKIFND